MFTTSLSDLSALTVGNASLPMLLLKATIVLVVALGVTLAMQRASAGSRHLVWLVTLGTLLLVPALGAWAPLRLAILPAVTTAPAPTMWSPAADHTTGGQWNGERSAGAVATAAPAPALEAAPESPLIARLRGMSPVATLLAAWAAVMLAIGASLAWAGFAVRRIVRRAQPLDTHDWRTPLWEVSDRLGLDEPPRLLRSDEARMPFACGMFTPTIVLPADCDGWSLDRRHAVLLHELAHVRRRDLLGHTLGRLVCALYWFHPLVWTAAKQLRAESERACDDLALACGTRATDYAEHLLDIVTSVRQDATPVVALAMARRKEFEGRMLAILDPELRHSRPTRLQSAGLVVALALVALVVGAAAPTARVASAAPAAPQQERSWPQQERSWPQEDARRTLHERVDAEPVSNGVAGAVHGAVAGATSVASASVSANAAVAANTTVAAASASQAPPPSGFSSARELRDFLQQEQHAQQKDSDERPVLLARVLRTDSSASLRRVAAWGLSEYADAPVASEALANALRRDADAGVREMAAWSLGHGGDGHAAAAEALDHALRHDTDDRVRATAAWTIGHLGDHAAVDALVAALGDASPAVRARAAWAIGSIGPKQAPPALIALVRDKDPHMRKLAAWALYTIEDPAAIPALEAALAGEQEKEIQLADIRALAAMGERSVDALRGLLESPDPRVKSMAVRALAGGHAAGPWPWPWPEPRPYP